MQSLFSGSNDSDDIYSLKDSMPSTVEEKDHRPARLKYLKKLVISLFLFLGILFFPVCFHSFDSSVTDYERLLDEYYDSSDHHYSPPGPLLTAGYIFLLFLFFLHNSSHATGAVAIILALSLDSSEALNVPYSVPQPRPFDTTPQVITSPNMNHTPADVQPFYIRAVFGALGLPRQLYLLTKVNFTKAGMPGNLVIMSEGYLPSIKDEFGNQWRMRDTYRTKKIIFTIHKTQPIMHFSFLLNRSSFDWQLVPNYVEAMEEMPLSDMVVDRACQENRFRCCPDPNQDVYKRYSLYHNDSASYLCLKSKDFTSAHRPTIGVVNFSFSIEASVTTDLFTQHINQSFAHITPNKTGHPNYRPAIVINGSTSLIDQEHLEVFARYPKNTTLCFLSYSTSPYIIDPTVLNKTLPLLSNASNAEFRNCSGIEEKPLGRFLSRYENSNYGDVFVSKDQLFQMDVIDAFNCENTYVPTPADSLDDHVSVFLLYRKHEIRTVCRHDYGHALDVAVPIDPRMFKPSYPVLSITKSDGVFDVRTNRLRVFLKIWASGEYDALYDFIFLHCDSFSFGITIASIDNATIFLNRSLNLSFGDNLHFILNGSLPGPQSVPLPLGSVLGRCYFKIHIHGVNGQEHVFPFLHNVPVDIVLIESHPMVIVTNPTREELDYNRTHWVRYTPLVSFALDRNSIALRSYGFLQRLFLKLLAFRYADQTSDFLPSEFLLNNDSSLFMRYSIRKITSLRSLLPFSSKTQRKRQLLRKRLIKKPPVYNIEPVDFSPYPFLAPLLHWPVGGPRPGQYMTCAYPLQLPRNYTEDCSQAIISGEKLQCNRNNAGSTTGCNNSNASDTNAATNATNNDSITSSNHSAITTNSNKDVSNTSNSPVEETNAISTSTASTTGYSSTTGYNSATHNFNTNYTTEPPLTAADDSGTPLGSNVTSDDAPESNGSAGRHIVIDLIRDRLREYPDLGLWVGIIFILLDCLLLAFIIVFACISFQKRKKRRRLLRCHRQRTLRKARESAALEKEPVQEATTSDSDGSTGQHSSTDDYEEGIRYMNVNPQGFPPCLIAIAPSALPTPLSPNSIHTDSRYMDESHYSVSSYGDSRVRTPYY